MQGVVLDADASTPARAILLTLTDSAGRVVARGASDEAGAFALAVAAPARITVRALRVGFRPTELAPVELAVGDTVRVRLVLGSEPVRLAAITVRRSDPCRGRDPARRDVAVVWEEARKALTLVGDSVAAGRSVAEWLRYERRLDSTGIAVTDQEVERARAPSVRPFRSRDAVLLARDGYVLEDEGGVTYFAPDAEVLLSDAFAAGHCFHLVADEVTDRIGLRFRPVAEDSRRRDVEGTLWLDRATAELRFLDFAYTGMPLAAAAAEPGGRVEFTRLPDGTWLVSRWAIRMPDLQRVIPPATRGGRIRVVGPSLVLRGVTVVGGEVTAVERDGVVVHRARGAGLEVRVRAAVGEAGSEAGAHVRLVGTDYEATTDIAGVARFPLVLPGRYEVLITDARRQADGERPLQLTADVRGDSLLRVEARLPARRLTAAALRLAPSAPVHAVVEFSVADSAGSPIPDVAIVAVDASGAEHRVRSDSAGRATLRELPLGTMAVEARRPGYYLAYGNVAVTPGLTPARVLLERMSGGQVLDTLRIEADADAVARHAAFEARRRAGTASASISRDDILRRNVVNAWQMLLTVGGVQLIEGPEGVLPASRRTMLMDLRSNQRPCYLRLAIDGVLLPDSPVNLRDRMPPPAEIHGIEVFSGPATIPVEYAGAARELTCGLIVVWTR